MVGPLVTAGFILGALRVLQRGTQRAGILFPLSYTFFAYALLVGTFGVSFKAAERLGYTVVDDRGIQISAPFEYAYFVVITGATVGYGDLCPSDWLTRLLAMLEAVEFWLFLGISLALILKVAGEPPLLRPGGFGPTPPGPRP
jgi:hypothetical protein